MHVCVRASVCVVVCERACVSAWTVCVSDLNYLAPVVRMNALVPTMYFILLVVHSIWGTRKKKDNLSLSLESQTA